MEEEMFSSQQKTACRLIHRAVFCLLTVCYDWCMIMVEYINNKYIMKEFFKPNSAKVIISFALMTGLEMGVGLISTIFIELSGTTVIYIDTLIGRFFRAMTDPLTFLLQFTHLDLIVHDAPLLVRLGLAVIDWIVLLAWFYLLGCLFYLYVQAKKRV